jgi:RHS repeat-associated protein
MTLSLFSRWRRVSRKGDLPTTSSKSTNLRQGRALARVVSSGLNLAILFFFAAISTAQSGPSPSFDPDDQTRTGAGLDTISPQNGALSLAIPIGPTYQVGPGLSFQMRLYYSSRIWTAGTWQLFPPSCSPSCTAEPNMLLDGDPALGLGWRLSFGKIVETSTAGIPAAYVAGDGSAHRLYNKRFFGGSADAFFYTRDGSYLRVKYLGSTTGYQMWTPDGNLTTLGHNVDGFDNLAANYVSDFGRGRDGWHATEIKNPYGDLITISYQSSGPATTNAWVPYQIVVPSIGGSGSRTVTVNMSGGPRIVNIQVPTFGGVTSTYSLTTSQHGSQLLRPFPHPTQYAPLQYYLDRIDLPISGYSYDFAYFDSGTTSVYANGAMSSQSIPTGASIAYTYGTWTWYHVNALNRPASCGYPLVQYPTGRPTLKTGPGIEPTLTHPGLDCAAADRAAGVVQRTVSYSTLSGTDTSTTKYYEYDYGDGEPGSGSTTAQSQTVIVSPADNGGKQHSSTYLFSVSTDKAISGPLVGALLRTALYTGDLGLQSSVPGTLSALRVRRFTYGTDNYDTNPVDPSSEAFEANRRVSRDVTIYSGIGATSPPSGRYHTVDYLFDSNAGQYSKTTHTGTVGVDTRETEAVWTPQNDSTHWKLDLPQTLYLRATAGGSNFSTVGSVFDGSGFPTTTTITDANYGSLQHSTPRDGDGFPSSEVFSHNGGYTRNLTFVAGTLKTSQWSGFSWYAVNNNLIDSSTGLVSMSTDPAGISTSFTYDAFGRSKVTTPSGNDAPTTITYGTPTQATAVTQGSTEHAWSQAITDSLGRPIKVKRKMAGGTTSKKISRYDKQGNATFESEWVPDGDADSSAKGTTFSNFDDFGSPKTITQADGKTTTVDYSDGSSYPNSVWKTAVTIGDVGGSSSTTTYTSDAFGNLTTVSEPSPVSADTTYTYNPQNRLTGVSQGGQTRSFTYDAFGFIRKENFPEKRNQDVLYSYDGLGNAVTETQPGSLTINRTYDGAGRLTGVVGNGVRYLTNCYDGAGSCVDGNQNFPGGSHPNGKLTRQIGFNPSGNPVSTFTEDFDYSDSVGRLSARTRTNTISGGLSPQVEGWIYGGAGEVVQYTHPRSTGLFAVQTSYDHGLPTGVRANGLPVVVNVTYQPSGLLATYATGNDAGHNVTTTIAADLNSLPRPRQISTSGASQNFDTGVYSYDGAGNITGMVPDTFAYDKLSRLTSATLSGLGSQTFNYDRWGSLTSTGGVNPRSFSMNSSFNQLSSGTYDSRGNLTDFGGTTHYQYDSLDRLFRYQGPGADWNYLFDGAGERLIKTPTAGPSSNYFWTLRDESNRIVTEYQGTALSRDNVYLGSVLVGSFASCSLNGLPAWTYYSSDHLGTPRLISDANGATQDSRKYWPYGDEASSLQPASAQRLRLATMERDTEGSGSRYYDHARTYEFQLAGRFLSVDLVGGDPSLPQSFNRYSYAGTNPANFVDPSGMDFEADVVFAAAGETLLEKLFRGAVSATFDNGDLIIEGHRIPGYLLGASACEACSAGSGGDSLTREEAARAIFTRVANLTEGPVNLLGMVLIEGVIPMLGPAALLGGFAAPAAFSLASASATLTTGVAASVEAGTVVYRVLRNGKVIYVGISKNFAARRAVQYARFGRDGVQVLPLEGIGVLARLEARGIEQALIELYRLGRNGGTLVNQINSIARTRPYYAQAVARAREVLRAAGYLP